MSGPWPWCFSISGKRFWICPAEEMSTWCEDTLGVVSHCEEDGCRVEIKSSTFALLVE